MTQVEAVQGRPRTAPPPGVVQASPFLWAMENATVVLPIEGRQRMRPFDYQARFWMDRSPRRIVLKARQTGVSNAIAIEALHTAVTKSDATLLFVSRNQQLAQELIGYCQRSISGLRDLPALTRESQGELVFANGSRIVSLPANPTTGRGIAATDVYLDEFAFCAYADLVYESVIGTVSTGGRVTVASTANGRNNPFFRIWSGLEGGEWSRHRIHWSERYTEEWAERTRAGMTRQAFAQEFDCDFISSGDNVFDPQEIAAAREGWNPDPEGCSEIITAWDIGRRRDHTVGISIGLRGDIWHEVAYERCLESYPLVQARIENRARRFPGATRVESNGVGDPVIENLLVRVEPFVTTAKTKMQAIQALQLLLQKGRFRFGSEQLGRELAVYEYRDEGLVTDSVIASAIAADTALDPLRRYAQVFGKSGHVSAPVPKLNPREPVRDLNRIPELAAYLGQRRRP